MAGEQITPELKQFIQETINSAEQLEVLLFMVSNPDRDWSIDEVADRIRASRESVSEKLASLYRAQLLVIGGEAKAPVYRYNPGSSALAQEVADSLMKAYREGKDTLIQIIYSRPMDNIRFFADAFRIRKKD